MHKQAIVIHSGGMDSSICLKIASETFGPENILSLSFAYNQRHTIELQQAAFICAQWEIDHTQLSIDCLQAITTNALMNKKIAIEHLPNQPPNTLVVGRNGLMAHLGGIHASHLGAHCLYMGVMELEAANSGYRDCSRTYMDLQEQILRLDLNQPNFEIRTPLINLNKKETMRLADQMGVLDFLIDQTITCYEGLFQPGCKNCPACLLRNRGIEEYLVENACFAKRFAKNKT